jgi:hypothetical protein
LETKTTLQDETEGEGRDEEPSKGRKNGTEFNPIKNERK